MARPFARTSGPGRVAEAAALVCSTAEVCSKRPESTSLQSPVICPGNLPTKSLAAMARLFLRRESPSCCTRRVRWSLTVHANFRYLEKGDAAWFGGGMDLTPYYPHAEDAVHFHRTIKSACDLHDATFYPRFKKWCDEYFFLKHRGETRGVGGIFFDYLDQDREKDFAFVRAAGDAFLNAYVPIAEKRRSEPFTDRHRQYQLYRRGRYVEFNLLYDRGTIFGLETRGRTESILMSLPPLVRWVYDFKPESGSLEERNMEFFKPRDWV